MAQYARPIQDITVNNWTDEGTVDNDGYLYTSLDEVTSDGDDSYIMATNQSGDICEVKLGSVTEPTPDTGHVLHVLYRSIGSGGPEKVDIFLFVGTTEVLELPNQSNRSGSYTDCNYTLSEAEAAALAGNYDDIRIRLNADTVGSGEEIRVTQAYLEVPDAVTYVDFSAVMGGVSSTPVTHASGDTQIS